MNHLMNHLNYFRCTCGHSWADVWDCSCQDTCPSCGQDIDPWKTVELDLSSGELIEQDEIPSQTTYIQSVTVTDPDSNAPVEVEIRKDNESGAMIGLDASHLEQDISEGVYYDPYNKGKTIFVPDDE